MKYISIFLLIFLTNNVYSLKCKNHPTVDERIESATDIFIGEVIEIKSIVNFKSPGKWSAKLKAETKLKVIDVIKGSDRIDQLVDFSYKPEIGVQYIIFNNNAFSSACTFNYSYKVDSKRGIEILEKIN